MQHKWESDLSAAKQKAIALGCPEIPNSAATACAADLLDSTAVEPFKVGPTMAGGIAVWWRSGSLWVLAECFNNGQLAVLFEDRKVHRAESKSFAQTAEAAQEIQDFLGAKGEAT